VFPSWFHPAALPAVSRSSEPRTVTIKIRLFAHMAQQTGESNVSLDLPDASTLAAIQPFLEKKFPTLRWPPGTMLAVNQEYAGPHHPLHENDEVAIIPPVSGG
jgi:molybdopterin converting factor subunit 1